MNFQFDPEQPSNSPDAALCSALELMRSDPPHVPGPFAWHMADACAAARNALGLLARDGEQHTRQSLAAVVALDNLAHLCYRNVGRRLLAERGFAAHLPEPFLSASADLFRELADAYARAPQQDEGRPANVSPAWHVAHALCCLSTHAKWTYFMHQASGATLWRALHELYMRVEALGVEHETVQIYSAPEPLALSCSDLYVQSLLLGMLNAGNLTPAQIELAHRWVTAFVRGVRMDSKPNSDQYVFHVRLDSDHGAEVTAVAADATGKLRFVDIEPICTRLVESREELRHGRIDLGDVDA